MRSRAWEFILATILCSGVIVVAWLYILVFCEIYSYTATSWLTSGLTSLLISLGVVQTVMLFVLLISRWLAKLVKNE
jgi:hypothetical protein